MRTPSLLLLPFLAACVGGGGAGGQPSGTPPSTTTSVADVGPYEGVTPDVVVRATTDGVHTIVPLADGHVAMIGPTPSELVLPDGTAQRQSDLEGDDHLLLLHPDGHATAFAQADGLLACASAGGLVLAVHHPTAITVLDQPLAAGETLVLDWTASGATVRARFDDGDTPTALTCAPSTGEIALLAVPPDSDRALRLITVARDGEVGWDDEVVMNSPRVALGDDGGMVVTGWFTDATVGPHRVHHLEDGSQDSLALAIGPDGAKRWEAVVSGGAYDQSWGMTMLDDGTFLWVTGETDDAALIYDGTGTRHQPFDVHERTYVLRMDLQTGALLDLGQTEIPTFAPVAHGDLTFLSIDTVRWPGPLHDLPNESGGVLFALDDDLQPYAARTLVPEAWQQGRLYGAVAADAHGLWVVGGTHLVDDDPALDLPVAVARLPWPDLE